MCDSGVDETVVHVILVCGRCQRERMEMVRVVLGCEWEDHKNREEMDGVASGSECCGK